MFLSTTEPQEEKQPGVATKRCKSKAQKSQKRIHAPAATAVLLEPHVGEKTASSSWCWENWILHVEELDLISVFHPTPNQFKM